MLNPSTSPPRADPDQLNKYFIATNEMTLGTTPDATSDLLELAKSLPEHSQRSFKLCHVTFEDVMNEIHHLHLSLLYSKYCIVSSVSIVVFVSIFDC